MSGVTNTQLAKKIDDLSEVVHEFKLANERRIVYLETCYPEIDKNLEKLEGKVDTIQKRGYILDSVVGAIATIATILGVSK